MADTAPPPRPLRYGEALTFVNAQANRNPRFALHSMAGRFVLLCAVANPADIEAQNALKQIKNLAFDESVQVCAVFAAVDQVDDPLLREIAVDKLVFADSQAARACGLIDPSDPKGRWILLDPTLRVMALWPLSEVPTALAALAATPAPDAHAATPLHAPVLIVPRVFEPEFSRHLINYYQQRGGAASGVTQENAEGKTVVNLVDTFKRREDCLIEDAQLRNAIMQRMFWRLTPEIEKAFMWRPTRMERYLVARYDGESGGFFKPHRDNTTAGTAHRRFAVTINLNAGEYEGGDLRFPEFGQRTYRAPTGGAVVFSCGLLHEATPVTRGARFAFLPFLYDEAAAEIRRANNAHLDDSIGQYQG